jgi:hypothetical protein
MQLPLLSTAPSYMPKHTPRNVEPLPAMGHGVRLKETRGCNQPLVGRILIAHAEAGAAGEHACGNVHGEELLEEKFGRVRDVDL